jgi:hypothetical protein
MQSVLAIDLAPRFSAAVLLNAGSEVAWQADVTFGFNGSHAKFLQKCTYEALNHDALLLCESVPQVPRFDTGVKEVCRNQGVLLYWTEFYKAIVYFVPPALWQHGLGIWKMQDSYEAWAIHEGYRPPDLLGDWERGGCLALHEDRELHGKERAELRAMLKKITSDYVASFLIAHWCQTKADLLSTVPSVEVCHPNGRRWIVPKTKKKVDA